MACDFTTGNCGGHSVGKFGFPDPGHVLAPFIRMEIAGEGLKITVGNQSSPNFEPANTACILSMQYGQSDGAGCTIEIADEEGGAFEKFFRKIVTNLNNASSLYKVQVVWGWISQKCGEEEVQVISTSQTHNFILKRVQVKYESVIKFILEAKDFVDMLAETRVDIALGEDDHPMPLKEAIRDLFKKSNPSVPSVQFKRKLPDGNTEDWDFKLTAGDGKAPEGTWRGDQQNVISTVQNWIRGYTTDRGRGMRMAWNDAKEDPEIIFWEDGSPDCDEVKSNKQGLRTYVVNGGQCSPVISFQPDMNWIFALAARVGGNIDSYNTSARKQHQDNDKCDFGDDPAGVGSQGGSQGKYANRGAGTTTSNAPNSNAFRDFGEQVGKEVNKNEAENHRANTNFLPMSAQLVIQGDPELDHPFKLRTARIGLIVVNPFRVILNADGCDWTSVSDCNDILSNSNWIIWATSHDIKEGSYTTTLKLKLTAPGSEINKNSPLGGASDGIKI